ncbi:MAG TPA: Nif3-like dinuclear metal center hexameric protein [Caldisericia bacterium]|nr:Nif3-like dinuclear metal center hexameric protein [Caldisericia bacterium]HPF48252.1 Nif3-like dinuclear metal center hexameric protein [Caldisericia bacterium]HPI83812.1 Nif3-like dinuclear metal center hexameric protein [Caldisericia bacterium]HPQ92705.1 Nif3-like dinuclear metal center hexameric protein [Caldisericia bacterium]HRV74197.1 Nif3-like dinuclear metal center hexameric protein [Caldisericia bacterium]
MNSKTFRPVEVASLCDGLLADSADPQDKSMNGLQVDAGVPVGRVGIAVDACMDAFVAAKEEGCQFVITHHGLYWQGLDPRAAGVMGNRLRFLFENGISLWSCHIPIDRHLKYGNNIGLAKILEISNLSGFGEYHGQSIGLYGNIKTKSIMSVAGILSSELPSSQPIIWDFGKKEIESIGVVSGGGAFAITEAHKLGLDLLVTGEVGHSDYHTAKDLGISVVAAGHWATETVGVKLIGEELKKQLSLETRFLMVPTGM